MGLVREISTTPLEQLHCFKAVGFDAFFSMYGAAGQDIAEMRRFADDIGLVYQSVHGPASKIEHLWDSSAYTPIALDEIMRCLDACAENQVPIVVIHAYRGFNRNFPTSFGIDNFHKIVDHARTCGVQVAIENMEGPAYLEALMKAFEQDPTVGFCWDSGHENCYYGGADLLASYGKHLIATHLNDNLGCRQETIAATDDLHLIPYDGIIDWEQALTRLNRCHYEGTLTFEVKIHPLAVQTLGVDYARIPFREYVARVHQIATQFRHRLATFA